MRCFGLKKVSGESACNGSGFLVVLAMHCLCHWNILVNFADSFFDITYLPSQENTLKLEPNFRDFGDSFRPHCCLGDAAAVWSADLDINILSSLSAGCVGSPQGAPFGQHL